MDEGTVEGAEVEFLGEGSEGEVDGEIDGEPSELEIEKGEEEQIGEEELQAAVEDEDTGEIQIGDLRSLRSEYSEAMGESEVAVTGKKYSFIETLLDELIEAARIVHDEKPKWPEEYNERYEKQTKKQGLEILKDSDTSEYESHMLPLIQLYTDENRLTTADCAWPRFAGDEPDLVFENLLCMSVINPKLMVMEKEHVLMRTDHYTALAKKVKLISGGRSGMEPLFSGYVGRGMLTAVVVGDKNNAPKSLAIYKTIKELALDHKAGIIIIIPNDFDSRLVFGLAMERARRDGVVVDMIVITDDACDNVTSKVGRRGLAGIILAFKVAGAMAEAGEPMGSIYVTVRSLAIATISAHITDTKVMIGTGFRDGGGRIDCSRLRKLITCLLDFLTNPKRYFSIPLYPISSLVLFVNSYTADRAFLFTAVAEILRQMFVKDVEVVRLYAGNFASSVRGLSITILKDFEDDVYKWLDADTHVDVWPKNQRSGILPVVTTSIEESFTAAKLVQSYGPIFKETQCQTIPAIISNSCTILGTVEAILNEIDIENTYGTCLSQAAMALAQTNMALDLKFSRPYIFFHQVANVIDSSTLGSVGALLTLLFGAIGNEFLKFSEVQPLSVSMWGEVLRAGTKSVKMYGSLNSEEEASVCDVLDPVSDLLLRPEMGDLSTAEILCDIISLAERCVESTKFKPRGRHKADKPEPGALAALLIFKSMEDCRKIFNF